MIALFCPSFLNWIDGKILRFEQCNKFDVDLSIVMQNMRLTTEPISTLTNADIKKCIKGCVLAKECTSLNHKQSTGICELLDKTSTDVQVTDATLEKQTGWTHYETDLQNHQVVYTLNK